ncbi:GNAT family N-acetyltransferase [Kitasatospora viridis]|uniref:RimJ/RimL family protein N-acetyltransferase n=1 Tax=Kitasatospora viridis TaxID=281105 RepID=A0A561T6U6_9ACTN|nr:GNAT family N-acetyltransferase [Kitasatospora viridis]TWF82834.1 RimJ/RimL family protein N-acetyltransferase [Kitasatospora viridis]
MIAATRFPPPTERLTFSQIVEGDLDDLAALLADPEVMRYYPRPKTREEARGWLEWNRGLYAERGFGLWTVRLTATGEYLGDCGLTPQLVEGVTEIEVGYHVRADRQGRGYATEAAAACRDHAREVLGVSRLIALIHPDNLPSQRVAEKIGLGFERTAVSRSGLPVRVHAARLRPAG